LSKLIRRTLPFVALIVAVLLAYKISQTQPDVSHIKGKTAPRLTVETRILEPSQFVVAVESFGTIQARTQSELFSLVSGQVATVSPRFKSGAFFNQGEVLLSIDTADYEIAVQVAKGDVINAELALAEAQARHAQAQRDWKTQKKQSVATDFALHLPQIRAAEANLDTAKAQLKLARLNLERTSVRAPYDGRILETFVDIGSVIGSNVRLAKVYSADAIEVRLPIANRDLHFVDFPEPGRIQGLTQNRIGHHALTLPSVRIENSLVDPAEIWQGNVIRTEAAIDPISQQLFVVARVDNPFLDGERASTQTVNKAGEHSGHARPLKIGQYVRASIRGKTLEQVIVIPNSAVYQGSYVYLVEDQTLQRKNIDVLWRNQQVSVLKSGLQAGDHLVTTLLGQVTSGTAVTEKLLSGVSKTTKAEPQPAFINEEMNELNKELNKEVQP